MTTSQTLSMCTRIVLFGSEAPLSKQEVAVIVGKSTRSVERLIAEKRLIPFQTSPEPTRFKMGAIAAYLNVKPAKVTEAQKNVLYNLLQSASEEAKVA